MQLVRGILAGGTFEPASIEAVKAGRTQMRREKGNYPASVNEDGWPRLFKRLAAENGFTADDAGVGRVDGIGPGGQRLQFVARPADRLRQMP